MSHLFGAEKIAILVLIQPTKLEAGLLPRLDDVLRRLLRLLLLLSKSCRRYNQHEREREEPARSEHGPHSSEDLTTADVRPTKPIISPSGGIRKPRRSEVTQHAS